MLVLHAGSSVLQLIQVLLIFLFVLAVTYITTKFIAGYQKGTHAEKNIQVIEAAKVGNNKYVQIVKAADRYLVIGVSKDSMILLAELTEEEVRNMKPAGGRSGKQFQDYFNDVVKRVKDRLPKK